MNGCPRWLQSGSAAPVGVVTRVPGDIDRQPRRAGGANGIAGTRVGPGEWRSRQNVVGRVAVGRIHDAKGHDRIDWPPVVWKLTLLT